ncbi:MAG TPA: hypothetical protein DIC42_06155 [Holosporales bacterium]|nr:hypothetical protein [Holosporales bacterium]
MEHNNFIDWRSFGKSIDNTTNFENFEETYGLILPESYKNLVRFRDGGVLKKDLFYYQFQKDNYRNCVGRFLCWNEKKYSFQTPPPFLPKGLVPFDEDKDGNFICFDYRIDPELDNPPVVDWNYKKNNGSLLSTYQNPPEFFPKGFIPFSEDGGGNYICFDYRTCSENPLIVYWDHGIEENEGIFFLADSFEEFLSMLKSEEEIAALETSQSLESGDSEIK